MWVVGIEKDDVSVQWAAAGSNVTIYLANIDPIHLRFVYENVLEVIGVRLMYFQYRLRAMLAKRRSASCLFVQCSNNCIRYSTTDHWWLIC